jgi:phosphoserine phosphatase SerB
MVKYHSTKTTNTFGQFSLQQNLEYTHVKKLKYKHVECICSYLASSIPSAGFSSYPKIKMHPATLAQKVHGKVEWKGIQYEVVGNIPVGNYLFSPQLPIEHTESNHYETLPFRFVITCIGDLNSHLHSILHVIPRNISRIKQLSHSFSAIDIYFSSKEEQLRDLHDILFQLSQEIKVDLSLQKDDIYRRHKRLFVFDMDSTLIQQEVIDELAREAGVYHKIATITEAAMRGELDFNQSLCSRVALLKDQPISIIDIVRGRIQFTPGAAKLCKILKRLGCRLAVLSGGFMPLAMYVKNTLCLDYAFANELQYKDHVLMGTVSEPIVNAERKRELLYVIAQAENIPTSQVFRQLTRFVPLVMGQMIY